MIFAEKSYLIICISLEFLLNLSNSEKKKRKKYLFMHESFKKFALLSLTLHFRYFSPTFWGMLLIPENKII